jgi:hypothetical protein
VGELPDAEDEETQAREQAGERALAQEQRAARRDRHGAQHDDAGDHQHGAQADRHPLERVAEEQAEKTKEEQR